VVGPKSPQQNWPTREEAGPRSSQQNRLTKDKRQDPNPFNKID
jgi:hypothetical protein